MLHEDLVIRFNPAVNVNKLLYLLRNNDNRIYLGNVYGQFYFDRNGWQALGAQEGDRFYLEYGNVPDNCWSALRWK